MTLTEKFRRLQAPKFSFAKSSEYSMNFARECNSCSMYDTGFGLGIPTTLSSENKLRGVFLEIMNRNGLFLFNISGVNLKRAARGFRNYEEAENNNQITEWELNMILVNKDYLKTCIFHNGKVHFKKRILWKSIK